MTGTDAGEQCDKAPDPGSYQATVTLLRDDGSAVTNAVSTIRMDVVAQAGSSTQFPISFEMPDFLRQDYTGTLDFYATWGAPGVSCAKANPPVTQESILLRDAATGMMVPGMTVLGTKLDGTPGSCFTSDMISKTYEEIDNLPWGRYHLSVYSPQSGFCGSVPVFVNPGKFNTTYPITVPMYQRPGQDGGVGDGGTDDGGMSPSDGGAATCP
jgi:hypothetical protein